MQHQSHKEKQRQLHQNTHYLEEIEERQQRKAKH